MFNSYKNGVGGGGGLILHLGLGGKQKKTVTEIWPYRSWGLF